MNLTAEQVIDITFFLKKELPYTETKGRGLHPIDWHVIQFKEWVFSGDAFKVIIDELTEGGILVHLNFREVEIETTHGRYSGTGPDNATALIMALLEYLEARNG